MRKLFWCGTLLAVMAVAAVFTMADYAQQYPDSPMGSCVLTACRVAATLDPVMALAPRVGQAAYQATTALTGQSDEPAGCANACSPCVAEPKPIPPLEVIDLSMLANAEMGVEEEASAPEPAKPEEEVQVQYEVSEAPAKTWVSVPPTPLEEEAAVEEDAMPDTMPPATDEDEDTPPMIGAEEQSGMPATEDLVQEITRKQILGFWMGLFHLEQADANEQALPEELPMPTKVDDDEDDSMDEPPQATEDVPAQENSDQAQRQSDDFEEFLKAIYGNPAAKKNLEIERHLDSPINLEFKDTPLAQVVEDLRVLTGLNIVIDQPALDKDGFSMEQPISLRLEGVSMKSALSCLLHQCHLTYVIKDDVLQITTESVGQEPCEQTPPATAEEPPVLPEHADHCPRGCGAVPRVSGFGGCIQAQDQAEAEKDSAAQPSEATDEYKVELEPPRNSHIGGCIQVQDQAEAEKDTAAGEQSGEHTSTWIYDFWKSFFQFDQELASPEDVPEELPMPTKEPAEAEETPVTDDPGTEEMPMTDSTPAVPEPSAGEESEAMPGTPPDCREDPHHDHQYPGCPYMGGCPGMQCPPPAPGDLDAKPKTKKKKQAAAHPEAVEDTAIRRMKYEEFAEPSVLPKRRDWMPTVPTVDTMEFRRSDAKPGEFDPHPF